MNQTTNRLFDELARVMTNAAGAAQGVREEVEGVMRAQAERILNDMDMVNREEFDAVRDMAAKAREENERLDRRIVELESELKTLKTGKKPATRKRAPAKKA